MKPPLMSSPRGRRNFLHEVRRPCAFKHFPITSNLREDIPSEALDKEQLAALVQSFRGFPLYRIVDPRCPR